MSNPSNDSAPTSAIDRNLMIAAIGLTVLTCGLALLTWAQDNSWHFGGMSTYQLFPVLGLLAFSIMWSQYVMEGAKNFMERESALTKYFTRTSFMVLLLILLHPGLLIAQRFHDGYGLPPGSYKSYVAPSEAWIATLGSLSLLMFLAFELKRWYGKKPWWKYVIMLNDVAILAIFFHGLRLGQETAKPWYQTLWYAYGIILIAALGYKYYYAMRVKKSAAAL